MNSKKVWFITGASKGLGLSLAKRLLKEGHAVAATSRSLSSLVKSIGEVSDNFLPLEVNLSDEASIATAVQATVTKFKTIDVLVNNAGYGQTGAVEEVSDKEARANYEVNVFGLLNVTRGVLPIMRKQKTGYVFNISSVGGYVGNFPGWGIYCSTKFAVSGITEGMHADLKPLGIHAVLVYPGYFRTNFLDKGSMVKVANEISDYQAGHESIKHHENGINNNQPGDPEKAALALMKLAEDKNPPLHAILGSDGYEMSMQKLKAFEAEITSLKEFSYSTDY